MIHVEERDDLAPRCPHCEKDLHKVLYQKMSALLGKRYVYFCDSCRAVLGVSHRKGFWMG